MTYRHMKFILRRLTRTKWFKIFLLILCLFLVSELVLLKYKVEDSPYDIYTHGFSHAVNDVVRENGGPFSPTKDNNTDFLSQLKFLLNVSSACNVNFKNLTFHKTRDKNWIWNNYKVAHSPQLGKEGPYRVVHNFIEGKWNGSRDAITYSTHATPEYLYHIVALAQRWDGPLSVSIYVPGTDIVLAIAIILHMCRCFKNMNKVSFHLIFSVTHPPEIDWPLLSDFLLPQVCSYNIPKVRTYRTRNNLTYPVNVARNVARVGARTTYVMVSDVELLPSKNLVPDFIHMMSHVKKSKKNMRNLKIVFVVPIFEVEKGEHFPADKESLVDLYKKERAVYFHRWVCMHCQKFPGLVRWIQKKGIKGVLQPFVAVKREYPYHRWEPIFIGTNKEPLYSELLSWEGLQDKMTQVYEMCLLNYKFIILDRAFLVHTPGMKHRSDRMRGKSPWRVQQERSNMKLYNHIIAEMVKKHGENKNCHSR